MLYSSTHMATVVIKGLHVKLLQSNNDSDYVVKAVLRVRFSLKQQSFKPEDICLHHSCILVNFECLHQVTK